MCIIVLQKLYKRSLLKNDLVAISKLAGNDAVWTIQKYFNGFELSNCSLKKCPTSNEIFTNFCYIKLSELFLLLHLPEIQTNKHPATEYLNI